MKHNYKELNNTLFAALDNIPEEKSMVLLRICHFLLDENPFLKELYFKFKNIL